MRHINHRERDRPDAHSSASVCHHASIEANTEACRWLSCKRGVIQGIEVRKIKEFDNILPIFTKVEIDGHKIPRCLLARFDGLSGACGEYARPERSGAPHVGLSAALDR